jgi:hypothetical protein
MNCLRLVAPLAAAVSAASLTSCETPAPATNPPAETATVDNGMAPRSIANHQMRYSDNHGSYTYTFFGDGRYRFASMSQNQTVADSREGRYQYAITSPGKSIVTFDDEPPIRLSFSGPLDATGQIEGDQRNYRFTFTRPDGE